MHSTLICFFFTARFEKNRRLFIIPVIERERLWFEKMDEKDACLSLATTQHHIQSDGITAKGNYYVLKVPIGLKLMQEQSRAMGISN